MHTTEKKRSRCILWIVAKKASNAPTRACPHQQWGNSWAGRRSTWRNFFCILTFYFFNLIGRKNLILCFSFTFRKLPSIITPNLVIDSSKLPEPLVVVQEWSVIKTIIIWWIRLCMNWWCDNSHFMPINSITSEKVFNFLWNLDKECFEMSWLHQRSF